MARPTKLTPAVQKRIVTAVKQGATYELAANYGGIAYNTFNEWMKHGQEETEGEFMEFYEAIKKAEGDATVKWLRVIEAAGKESWQAMAWKLERRYPRDYGRQVQEHTIGDKDVLDWLHKLHDQALPAEWPEEAIPPGESGEAVE